MNRKHYFCNIIVVLHYDIILKKTRRKTMSKLIDIEQIVIIDDSEYKRNDIHSYMRKLYPSAKIKELSAVNPALYYVCVNLAESDADMKKVLVITDMVMPLMHGFPFDDLEREAGFNILCELDRKNLECPVIVESSEDVDIKKAKELYKNTLGFVKESPRFYNLSKYEQLLQLDTSEQNSTE